MPPLYFLVWGAQMGSLISDFRSETTIGKLRTSTFHKFAKFSCMRTAYGPNSQNFHVAKNSCSTVYSNRFALHIHLRYTFTDLTALSIHRRSGFCFAYNILFLLCKFTKIKILCLAKVKLFTKRAVCLHLKYQ